MADERESRGSALQAWRERLAAALQARREAQLFRALRRIDSASGPEITCDGRKFVQFCTNNYLGLATDPELIEAARKATADYGTGAGASRLVAGSMALHHELEAALARFKHAEAALVFPSGFMANLAVLTTFAGAGDVIVSDKLNHASLLDAAAYSGAAHRTFPHRNAGRAGELLDRLVADAAGGQKAPTAFVVTDSVFSMDGDIADLQALANVADGGAGGGGLLVVDEAHGTGVLGPTGAGLAELQGVEDRVAVAVGTLSKALGSVGGFVTGPREVIDTLINAGRPFIYTTALPPACAAAALAALRIVEREPERRERVMALAAHVRREIVEMGFDCGDSATPIIPVIMGESGTAMSAAEFLKERRLFVPAIRPPTVAPRSARLRISLMATHTDGQVERLLEGMRRLRERVEG
jgi:8-amino-7-oxononanoate synthase